MATNKPPLSTNSSSSLVVPLQQLWADNFLVYFKSHVFHFNVQGQNFEGDHEYFQEVYEFLWEQHDVLGEQIRQMDKPVLTSLEQIISASSVDEAEPNAKDAKAMYTELSEEFDELIDTAQNLYDMAEEQCCAGLSTLLGDYIKQVSKLNWKAKATIGRSIK